MKIVFDNIIYSLQNSGGGSVYWTELIKRFNANKELDILFYEQKELNQNIFRKEFSLQNVKQETFLNFKIRRYLNFTKPIKEKSIFHSSYFRISKSKNAINVITIHDFTTEKFRTGLARWINLQQKKHAVSKSDGIICISENTKKDLLHFVPDVDADKIRVIYNGVSDDFFKINDDFKISEKNENFKDLENYKYLLYIGHRTNYKNFPIAVKTAAKVKDKYKFVVVGESFNDQEKIFVESLLGKQYTQISKLNNEGLNFLYNKAFALLYPSSYEGFGIPLVEAMKTHCPVIANKNSSIPEVVEEAAILCNDINADLMVEGIYQLENNTFRNDLIKKGLQQFPKFDWDKTYLKYLEFYKELYDGK
jgi:mannosyltransferase